MKKIIYLILATVLVLASCASETTDSSKDNTDTNTKTLNGACNYAIYAKDGTTEALNTSATCKDGGTTLTIELDTPTQIEGSKKVKKIVIDSNNKTVTLTHEDDSTYIQISTTTDTVTMTTKTDSWEVFINNVLNVKVTVK